MWHDEVLPREFFARLLAVDEAIAAQVRAGGCQSCGGPLCVGHFARKPRGGLFAEAGEDGQFALRFSYCCAREGCRRRATPPSVRFLGRKVYVECAILLACVVAPLVQERERAVRRATGIAARTVRRWQSWWRTAFVASALWVELKSRAPGIDAAMLPASMLAVFDGATSEKRLEQSMRFMCPLTSTTAPRSRDSRDAR